MLVTPGQQDPQKRMQVHEGYITLDTHPVSDELAEASEEDAELVDAERCRRGRHALRVGPRSVLLKGSPRYVALSKATASISSGTVPPSCTNRCVCRTAPQGWAWTTSAAIMASSMSFFGSCCRFALYGFTPAAQTHSD
jgi:hypothetical protein